MIVFVNVDTLLAFVLMVFVMKLVIVNEYL